MPAFDRRDNAQPERFFGVQGGKDFGVVRVVTVHGLGLDLDFIIPVEGHPLGEARSGP